jgi:hypothetical protein
VRQSLDADRHQYFAALHHDVDTDRYHVHLAINKVSIDGRVLDRWQDYAKLGRAAEWCEREMGLLVDRHVAWREKRKRLLKTVLTALRADAGYAGLAQHNPFAAVYETFIGRGDARRELIGGAMLCASIVVGDLRRHPLADRRRRAHRSPIRLRGDRDAGMDDARRAQFAR